MNVREQLASIQKAMRQLQGDAPLPESLQRQFGVLQREIRELKARPVIKPIPLPTVFTPIPPDVDLSPDELTVWITFLHYHHALLQEAGEVGRDQWIALMDRAANLTKAAYLGEVPVEPEPPVEPGIPEAPDTQNQPFARNGRLQTWSLIFPQTGAGLFGFNAATQAWESVVARPLAAGNLCYNGTTHLWLPLTVDRVTGAMSSQGVTDGSAAAAGQVGQTIEALTPTTTTHAISAAPANGAGAPWFTCISIALTPGDWELSAGVRWAIASIPAPPALATPYAVAAHATLSTTPDAGPAAVGNPSADTWVSQPIFPTILNSAATFVTKRYSTAVAQTWHLNVTVVDPNANIGNPALNALYAGFGFLHARRMR